MGEMSVLTISNTLRSRPRWTWFRSIHEALDVRHGVLRTVLVEVLPRFYSAVGLAGLAINGCTVLEGLDGIVPQLERGVRARLEKQEENHREEGTRTCGSHGRGTYRNHGGGPSSYVLAYGAVRVVTGTASATSETFATVPPALFLRANTSSIVFRPHGVLRGDHTVEQEE